MSILEITRLQKAVLRHFGSDLFYKGNLKCLKCEKISEGIWGKLAIIVPLYFLGILILSLISELQGDFIEL